jgi:hypothetical protein
MNKSFLVMILLAFAMAVPVPTMAGVNINVGIALPPPVVFAGPPSVIVLPDTNDVYVDPDLDVDLFFWDGWWWRPWDGRWYRSHYYDRGWVYYERVPSFYFDVDPGWRRYYRERDWHGHRWNYRRIPDAQLRRDWRNWHSTRHWERQGSWGVQGYQPRPEQHRQQLRRERQKQYQQRPEVQRHQQQMRERQKQPQGHQQRGEKQHQKSRGGAERGDREHGR